MTAGGPEMSFFSPPCCLFSSVSLKESQINLCLLHEVPKVIHSHCHFSEKTKKIIIIIITFVSP